MVPVHCLQPNWEPLFHYVLLSTVTNLMLLSLEIPRSWGSLLSIWCLYVPRIVWLKNPFFHYMGDCILRIKIWLKQTVHLGDSIHNLKITRPYAEAVSFCCYFMSSKTFLMPPCVFLCTVWGRQVFQQKTVLQWGVILNSVGVGGVGWCLSKSKNNGQKFCGSWLVWE